MANSNPAGGDGGLPSPLWGGESPDHEVSSGRPHSRTASRAPSPARKHAGRSERELTGRMVLLLLVAFFGIVFAVNGVMVREALSTFGGVETDSSYKAGQMFEHEVALAKAQDGRHWQVDAKLTPAAAGGTVLDIVARDAKGAALTGLAAVVTFERPPDRRLDRTLAVAEVSPGHFRGSAAALAGGQWTIVIELSRQGARRFRSVSRVVLQ